MSGAPTNPSLPIQAVGMNSPGRCDVERLGAPLDQRCQDWGPTSDKVGIFCERLVLLVK